MAKNRDKLYKVLYSTLLICINLMLQFADAQCHFFTVVIIITLDITCIFVFIDL